MVLSAGAAAFLPDLVHVHPEVVTRVTTHMAAQVMAGAGQGE